MNRIRGPRRTGWGAGTSVVRDGMVGVCEDTVGAREDVRSYGAVINTLNPASKVSLQ